MKYRAKKCAAPNRTIDQLKVVCHDEKKSELFFPSPHIRNLDIFQAELSKSEVGNKSITNLQNHRFTTYQPAKAQ